MRVQTPYDENYGTCSYAHAWLRIMGDDLDPDEITQLLKIQPTRTQRKGKPWVGRGSHTYKISGWFLSTEKILTSHDSRHHLDWILEHIRGKQHAFNTLHSRSYTIDACCRWDSMSGHGGPVLSPTQMQGFAELDIEVWYDIYLDGDESRRKMRFDHKR